MFHVDETREATALLRLSYHVRVSVVFPELSGPNTSTTRPRGKTLHSKGSINQDIPRGNNLHGRDRRIPKPANCFTAVVFFDLLNG